MIEKTPFYGSAATMAHIRHNPYERDCADVAEHEAQEQATEEGMAQLNDCDDVTAADTAAFAFGHVPGVLDREEFHYTSVEPAPVTLPVDVLSLNSAYAELATTRRQMAEAIEFEAMCQRVLNEREHALLMNGVIDGKNAELREAQMFNRTEPERAALLKAATKRRNAQLNLALATDAVQRLRTIVALITTQA